MYHFPIGIIADSFRKPMPEALATAAKLGAKGVQVYATRGEMSPEELTGQKRRDFLAMVKDNGLVISALCGDLGRGFGNPELNPQLIRALQADFGPGQGTGNQHRHHPHRCYPRR